MFSATEKICDYWDRLEVSKQPHGVGPRRSIYLPQSREDKPASSSVNRKHDAPQSQPHNYPDTEKNPHVLVWGSNSQPSSLIVMHATGDGPALPSTASPSQTAPGRPPGGHSRSDISTCHSGPVGAARATMAAVWRVSPWQVRPRAALGAQLHCFPPWEEPGAARTRLSPEAPAGIPSSRVSQRPRLGATAHVLVENAARP